MINFGIIFVKVFKKFSFLIRSSDSFFISILNIEREKEKPRKDYAKYSDIFPIINFFYDDIYNEIDKSQLEWNPLVNKEDIKNVLLDYVSNIDMSLNEEEWFDSMKELSVRHGFADNVKVWKKNKEGYKGHVGDVTGFLRLALAGRNNCPNLYFVIQILGKDKVISRVNETLKYLK